MTNASIQLSKPIDPARAETLFQAARIAKSVDVAFVLVGAFARDLHFEYSRGIHSRRETTDLDLSVQVQDWAHYERLRGALQGSQVFAPCEGRQERFTASGGVLLDIIPFGGVAETGEVIFWPPDGDRMSVVGVADALAGADTVDVVAASGTVTVRVASLPGLVVLKLVALYDRTEDRVKRDSDDIEFIMTHYLAAGNRARLADGPDADIARGGLLDLEVASARLLGRDTARMSSPATRNHILNLLTREARSSSICPFTQELRGLLASARGNFSRARQVVSALLTGYTEA